MTDHATILESQLPDSRDESLHRVQDAARPVASWDVDHRPSSPGSFDGRITAPRARSPQLEKCLARDRSERLRTGAAGGIFATGIVRACASHVRLAATCALAAVADRQELIGSLPRAVFAERREEPRARRGGTAPI